MNEEGNGANLGATQEAQPAQNQGEQQEGRPAQKEAEPKGQGSQPNPGRTFTQEEVNEIVRERLAKAKADYSGLGYESEDALKSDLDKAKAYGEIAKSRDELKGELEKANRELLFIKNRIDPSREGDILAIMGSKSLDLNQENLEAELKTHPEWGLRTISPKVGQPIPGKPEEETEEEKAKRFWRIKDDGKPIRL